MLKRILITLVSIPILIILPFFLSVQVLGEPTIAPLYFLSWLLGVLFLLITGFMITLIFLLIFTLLNYIIYGYPCWCNITDKILSYVKEKYHNTKLLFY